MAAAPRDLAPYVCSRTLDAFCAIDNFCAMDLATAEMPSFWPCGRDFGGHITTGRVYESRCAGYTFVSLYSIDTGVTYVYDMSGQLAALEHGFTGNTVCSGGPPELPLVECGTSTRIC